MTLQELLTEFANQIGMGTLTLDSQGACRLVFDARTMVDIAALDDSGGFILLSTIGPVPQDADPRLLRRFLGANLFARSANDAYVALDASLDEAVLLCRHESATMDPPTFQAAILEFVSQAQAWNEYIARGDYQSAPPPDVSPESLGGGGFIRA